MVPASHFAPRPQPLLTAAVPENQIIVQTPGIESALTSQVFISQLGRQDEERTKGSGGISLGRDSFSSAVLEECCKPRAPQCSPGPVMAVAWGGRRGISSRSHVLELLTQLISLMGGQSHQSSAAHSSSSSWSAFRLLKRDRSQI